MEGAAYVYEFENLTFNCTEESMGPRRDHLYVVIPIMLVYTLIFITGTIGNISTCIVIARNKPMHTATNYYLFSLAVSDLLLLLSGLPPEIYSIYSRYPYVFGSVFCFLRGMFAETSANATVLTITAFTVERYLAICHPFLSHTMSKLSRAIKLILGIWLVAIGLAVPQAMQFKIIGQPECELCEFVEPIIEHSFVYSTVLFFVLPMTLITVLYVLIGQKLRSSSMMKKRNSNVKVQSKSSKKIVKMLVAVVVAFFICWAPFHAQRLYATYLRSKMGNLYMKIYEIVTYISGILYYVSATINPILYNIMSAKFREAFKETFARCCCLSHFKAGRPQRSYSVLSRSMQRGPDSTDSGREDPTVQTHTTITQKSSIESCNGLHMNGRRKKSFITSKTNDIIEESYQSTEWLSNEHNGMKLLSKIESPPLPNRYISMPASPAKISKFWRYLECWTKGKPRPGAGKRLSLQYYPPSPNEPTIVLEMETKPTKAYASPCEISNSSLKDVENGPIEDELTSYMKEIKRREYYTNS